MFKVHSTTNKTDPKPVKLDIPSSQQKEKSILSGGPGGGGDRWAGAPTPLASSKKIL